MKKTIDLIALIFTLFCFLPNNNDFLPTTNEIIESVLFITQIKSFLDEDEKRKICNTSIFYNELLESLLNDIKCSGGSFFKVENLKTFFIIRSFLFNYCGKPLDRVLTLHELEELKNSVISILYEYKHQGFVNTSFLEGNKIYNLYRSLFLNEFIFSNPDSTSLKEIEYYQSLVILVLILEYELHIKYYEKKLAFLKTDTSLKTGTSVLIDGLRDLKQGKRELTQNLAKSIRQTMSGGRIFILNRIYTGFDTEYQPESDEINTLLAYTTSSYSRSYLCIKPFRLDLSEEDSPKTSEVILEIIKMIRRLTNKQDVEIDKISDSFTKDPRFKKQSTKNFIMFTLETNENDVITALKNSYFDLETFSVSYSFQNLVENSLLEQSENIFILNKQIIEVLKSYKIPRIPVRKELYLIAHFTTADICSLSDFQEIKNRFNILRKSFVTLEKAVRVRGWKVILRDTSLLSPVGASLSSISTLYNSEFKKINVPQNLKSDMRQLKKLDFELFRAYAMQDSKITLWHALKVEESNLFFTGRNSIPITLSSLASGYLIKELVEDTPYHNPLERGRYDMKNLSKVFTPTGVELSKDLSHYISYFLGSYHGGRNESFIYGLVQETVYDYDLPGAYPTAMSLLEFPKWSMLEIIPSCDQEFFMGMYGKYLFKSYTALKVEFSFPESVQYPVLPVRLDESSIFYPLNGISYCTGHEVLLAISLNCRIRILGGVFIPFKTSGYSKLGIVRKLGRHTIDKLLKDTGEGQLEVKNLPDPLFLKLETKYSQTPFLKRDATFETLVTNTKKTDGSNRKHGNQFFKTTRKLVEERLKYPKGSYMNQLYKFIANSGIGQMARGLNQKKVFDTETCKTKVIPPGELISPLYAGWITSYIRCTLSEILNNQNPDKKIFSCTTDGFISNEEGLEQRKPLESELFAYSYFKARESLTGTGELLERKHFDAKGLISWRTRGQLGLSGGIKAMTGYQQSESMEELIPKIISYFNSPSKSLPFIQTSLRSAKDIYLGGGHTTLKLNERWFNLRYDNRRDLIPGGGYYSSKPFDSIKKCLFNRGISLLGTKKSYQGRQLGDAYVSLTKRMLVRICLTEPLPFGVKENLTRSEVLKIMSVVGVKTLPNFLSKQKGLLPQRNSLPSTKKVMDILLKFKCIFPDFPIELLIRR